MQTDITDLTDAELTECAWFYRNLAQIDRTGCKHEFVSRLIAEIRRSREEARQIDSALAAMTDPVSTDETDSRVDRIGCLVQDLVEKISTLRGMLRKARGTVAYAFPRDPLLTEIDAALGKEVADAN